MTIHILTDDKGRRYCREETIATTTNANDWDGTPKLSPGPFTTCMTATKWTPLETSQGRNHDPDF